MTILLKKARIERTAANISPNSCVHQGLDFEKPKLSQKDVADKESFCRFSVETLSSKEIPLFCSIFYSLS